MRDQIIKRNKNFLLQKEEEQTIISTSKGDEFCILNPMSKYILDICDGKSCEQISQKIYEDCINKEELNVNQILSDCIEVIKIFHDKGIITYGGMK